MTTVAGAAETVHAERSSPALRRVLVHHVECIYAAAAAASWTDKMLAEGSPTWTRSAERDGCAAGPWHGETETTKNSSGGGGCGRARVMLSRERMLSSKPEQANKPKVQEPQ